MSATLSSRSRLIGRVSAIAAALALVSIGLAAPATAAEPAPSGTAGLSYVALGDSYTAGLGLSPLTGLPVPGCAQATVDYPHQVAASLGLVLDDRSCSEAKMENVLTTPQVIGGDTAPVQLASLNADTDVVTVMIGGNDLQFSDIIGSCIAQSATGPLFLSADLNCQAMNVKNGLDIAGIINTQIAGGLAATFSAIKAAAPKAKVFVAGYPALFPDAANTPQAGCFTSPAGPNSFPFTDIDVPYLHSLEVTLDSVTRTQAEAAGFSYLSSIAATVGHTGCAPAGDAYINGLTLTSFQPLAVDPSSFHPNAAGAAFLTGEVAKAIVTAFPAVTPVTPVTPAAPADPAVIVTPAAQLANTGTDASVALFAGLLALALIATGAVTVITRRRHLAD